MGMIVDCYLVEVMLSDIIANGHVDFISYRKNILKLALKNVNSINHKYAIEIPDDMAMVLDHTGHIERFTTHFVTVRCYMIDWDETEKLRQSEFKFGD